MQRFKREAHCLSSVVILLTLLVCPSSCQNKNVTTATEDTPEKNVSKPEANSTKKRLIIPVMAPIMGVNTDRFGYAVAARYAMDMINNRSDILKDYHLVPQIHDTVQSVPKALYITHQIVDQHTFVQHSPPPAIIGPSLSSTTIATAHSLGIFYILQYTYGATSPELDNHHLFQNLVRTYPGTKLFSKAHVALCKRFSWKRVAIVYDHHESDGIFNKITEDLVGRLKINNITIVGVESVDGGTNPQMSTSDEEIRDRLERLKAHDVKIFITQFSYVRAYRIFCQAYKLGMFGKDYVWIVHNLVGSVDKWLTAPTTNRNLDLQCVEDDYIAISERMFSFHVRDFRENTAERSISGLTVKEYNDYINPRRPVRGFLDTNYHTYIFDTIWSMALNLNKSIPELKAINSSLERMLPENLTQVDILRKNAYSVEFEGISGTVRLNKEQGRVGNLNLFQIRNKSLRLVGSYRGTTGKLDIHFDNEYLFIDGNVPSDSSRLREILVNIPLALYLPICVVAGLGMVLAVGVLIFNVYNRNERYIRKSAPLFNNMIIFGIMMCLSTVVFFGYPVDLGDTDTFLLMCKLRTWVLCLGFSLAFGSMFVKTWRVYKIFTNRKLKYSIERLSNSSLILMVFVIVIVDVFVLLLWKFVNPMEVKLHMLPKQDDPNDVNALILPILYSCHSDNQAKWLTSIYVLKGILLFYGLFLAYETRNVQFEHLNDSRMIGVCVYNCGVMSILGGLLSIILHENYYKESYGITAICIIFPSLGTLFLIFLPKVVRFVKRDHLSDTETTDGVVIESPAVRNGHNFHLRKDSVCSEGVTSVSSSIPCSNSRVMPIYEEANQATVSPTEASYVSESSA